MVFKKSKDVEPKVVKKIVDIEKPNELKRGKAIGSGKEAQVIK